MNTQIEERKYTTDAEAYETFVGSLSPEEFVKPSGSISKAIQDLLDTWAWDEPAPSWLKAALFRYVEDSLENL